MAGTAVIFDKSIKSETKSWVRWVVIAPIFLFISTALGVYFGTLTIQFADAPNLDALVGDKFTVDTIANLSFLALLAIAFFPKFNPLVAAVLLPGMLVSVGYQIQGQYQGFRLQDSAADLKVTTPERN